MPRQAIASATRWPAGDARAQLARWHRYLAKLAALGCPWTDSEAVELAEAVRIEAGGAATFEAGALSRRLWVDIPGASWRSTLRLDENDFLTVEVSK